MFKLTAEFLEKRGRIISAGRRRYGKIKFYTFIKEHKLTALSNYVDSKTLVKFRCARGHNFKSRPEYIYANVYACPECAKLGRFGCNTSKKEYQRQLNERFGNLITVIEQPSFWLSKCDHLCKNHGKFRATPQGLLMSNYGCSKCGHVGRCKTLTRSHNQVVALLKQKHGKRIVLLDDYIGTVNKHQFQCHKGHVWKATADSVIRGGSGCPTCAVINGTKKYSKSSVCWLKVASKHWKVKIKHAENGGEAAITGKSGKIYKVDGLAVKNKMVFEFDGDTWHGNPIVCKPDSKPNPFSQLTANQLCQQTLKRAKDIHRAGYTVVRLWEHDWKRGKMFSEILTHIGD